jgi:hypothetical protein
MPKLRKMDLTEVSTWFQKRSDRKMEVSRAKCGNNLPVILEIGATTSKKGLAFNIIKMVTSMRACGL